MTDLIVISIPSEAQALKASQKLMELESLGDITVYEKVIVKKELNGDITVLQTDTTEGLRTFSGMAIGTLIGALGGPIGMVVGMVSGTAAGALTEMDYIDFSEDIGSKVVDRIQPGTIAIMAEIEEDDPVFVDGTLAQYDGEVFRSDVDYVYEEYLDEQIEEIEEEIADERAKIKSAASAEKAKILRKVSDLKVKRQKRIAELKEKGKTTIGSVKKSIIEEKKRRLENRISKHQTKVEELREKLKGLEN